MLFSKHLNLVIFLHGHPSWWLSSSGILLPSSSSQAWLPATFRQGQNAKTLVQHAFSALQPLPCYATSPNFEQKAKLLLRTSVAKIFFTSPERINSLLPALSHGLCAGIYQKRTILSNQTELGLCMVLLDNARCC